MRIRNKPFAMSWGTSAAEIGAGVRPEQARARRDEACENDEAIARQLVLDETALREDARLGTPPAPGDLGWGGAARLSDDLAATPDVLRSTGQPNGTADGVELNGGAHAEVDVLYLGDAVSEEEVAAAAAGLVVAAPADDGFRAAAACTASSKCAPGGVAI